MGETLVASVVINGVPFAYPVVDAFEFFLYNDKGLEIVRKRWTDGRGVPRLPSDEEAKVFLASEDEDAAYCRDFLRLILPFLIVKRERELRRWCVVQMLVEKTGLYNKLVLDGKLDEVFLLDSLKAELDVFLEDKEKTLDAVKEEQGVEER